MKSKSTNIKSGYFLGIRGGISASLLSGFAIAFPTHSVLAQIIPDTTLGAEGSIVRPLTTQFNQIEGGAIRGVNLFHSFSEFNVGNGQSVYFVNPVSIENILSRVTGNNPSHILGTLGVLGNANLFLLNPNGIVFGENAQLDIRGSFVASTADSLVFDNGFGFSASNPDVPPLLTVNVPIGLQYGYNPNRGTITNTGNLTVGQDLMLLARNLDLQGKLQAGGNLGLLATDTVRVRDSFASPFIAKAGGELMLQGNRVVDIFALNNSESGFFSGGDMVFRSANSVGGDAHYWSGGNFRIEELDGSLGNLFSPYDPIIRSHGDVMLNGYIGASLQIWAGGSVTIKDRVWITEADPVLGSEPIVDIRAGMKPDAIGSPIEPTTCMILCDRLRYTTPPSSPDINIGTVVFRTFSLDAAMALLTNNLSDFLQFSQPLMGRVMLTNQYQPNTLLPGGDIQVRGGLVDVGAITNGGSFTIDSRGGISISSLIDTSSSAGNGGNISLTANNDITINSIINASGGNSGAGGSIILTSKGAISLENSLISSITNLGKGGDITFSARSASLSNNTRLVAATFGAGEGGNVNITTAESLTLTGTGDIRPFIKSLQDRSFQLNPSDLSQLPSGIFAASNGTGNGGDVKIETGELIAQNGVAILSSTLGSGEGGKLQVNASDLVAINNAALLTGATNSGNAGNLIINTPTLNLGDEAAVGTTTLGAGNAGDLTITSSEVTVQNEADISVDTRGSGDAGNLIINTHRLNVENESFVSAASIGSSLDAGKAGTLIINATEFVRLSNGGTILAQTRSTKSAGDVTINTEVLSVLEGGTIAAFTSGSGKGGNVIINATNSVEMSGTSTDGFKPSVIFIGTSGPGNGGDFQINTPTLTLRDGAVISGATAPNSTGRGGNVTVNADLVILRGTSPNNLLPSGLSVDTTGTGKAGDLTINTTRLLIENGAGISGSTFSPSTTGEGGNLIVNAGESVEIKGTSNDGSLPSGLYAQSFSDAKAGDLRIVTGELIIRDGGRVSVSGAGSEEIGNITNKFNTILDAIYTQNPLPLISPNQSGTGDAGNIDITTNRIFLNNGGQIIAETASGEGGNITLQVQDYLLMRNASKISTTAGNAQAGGNGGNVVINTPFIIGISGEDSDITANAYFGNGGRVEITGEGIYGLQFRPDLTPLSDITASSQFGFDGVVDINLPDISPSTELQKEPSGQLPEVSEVCQPGTAKTPGEFVNTRRGGKPPNPSDSLNNNPGWYPIFNGNNDISKMGNQGNNRQIVEAQGWVTNERGEVVALVANPPDFIPYGGSYVPSGCSYRGRR